MAIVPVGTAGRLEQDPWITTTVNVSVTVPSGCELLVLGLARDNGGDNWSLLTSVEVNGSATGVTSQVSSINDAGSLARIWTLVNPTAGTYNVTWTWGASSVSGGVYFALPMSGGIDTADPVSATNSSAAGSGSSPFSTSITVESGGVAVAVGRSDDQTISAVGSGQTAVGAMTAGGVISYKEDATAMAFSFTGTGAASQAVIAIRPGSGGGSSSVPPQNTQFGISQAAGRASFY